MEIGQQLLRGKNGERAQSAGSLCVNAQGYSNQPGFFGLKTQSLNKTLNLKIPCLESVITT